MNTQEVAKRFYELSQQGNWDAIQSELFADNAVSIEPDHSMGESRVEGLENIKKKGVQFNEMTEEVHSGFCNEPIVAGNHFSCVMGMDVTMKGQPRAQFEEIALYEVQNGKIVKEQFFYPNKNQ